MICPARFVLDAKGNGKEGGMAADACRFQTGICTSSKGNISLRLPRSPK